MAAATYQQVRNATRDTAFQARISVAVAIAQDAVQKSTGFPNANTNEAKWVNRDPYVEAGRIFFYVLNTAPLINTLGGASGDQIIDAAGIINPATFTDAQIQTAVDTLKPKLILGAING